MENTQEVKKPLTFDDAIALVMDNKVTDENRDEVVAKLDALKDEVDEYWNSSSCTF